MTRIFTELSQYSFEETNRLVMEIYLMMIGFPGFRVHK
jgi:hypothetical protein